MNKNDPPQYIDRFATKEDLNEILHWLKDDHQSSLINNRDLIQQGQQEERLVALIEKVSNKAIAFCLGGLTEGCGVFAVHPEMRRTGIGSILFHICLDNARKKNIAGLSIQCNPESSISFWEKCGFQIFTLKGTKNTKCGVFPIPHQFKLPENHKPIQITFELKDECDEEWSTPFSTDAAMIEEGTYQLRNRFVEYIPYSDILIRIQIDGQEINNKKVKYSTDHGVRYKLQKYGLFVVVDKICWKANQNND